MKSQRERTCYTPCLRLLFFFFFYHYARQNIFKRYYYGPSSLSFLHAFSVRDCSTAVLVHPLVFQPERHFRRNSDYARVYIIILSTIYYNLHLNYSTALSICHRSHSCRHRCCRLAKPKSKGPVYLFCNFYTAG